MANRNVPTSASASPVTGPSLLDTYAARFQALFDAIALVPTSVSNSGNDYTITISPVLEADVQNGMVFYVTPSAVNDGAVRLRVSDSNPYYDWTKADGTAYDSGDLSTGVVYAVLFIDGAFRTISSGAGSGDTPSYTAYTASGTFTKPATFNDDAVVFVEAWGAGGGGSLSTAGGGGAYNSRFFRLADLNGVETVTVGSGVGSAAGGKSAFGTHLEAYGGGGCSSTSGTAGGGGGGGATSVGGDGTATAGGDGGGPGLASRNGTGGGPGTGYYGGGGGDYSNGNGGSSIFGGGGGGGAVNGSGGDSLYGGGGGAAGTGTAGSSLYGGDGGADATAGSVPGGGGGAGSSGGGRGEVRVWIFQ